MICWRQRNANAFECGGIALGGHGIDGYEDVGFGVISGGAVAGDGIGDYDEAACGAADTAVVIVDIDDIVGF